MIIPYQGELEGIPSSMVKQVISSHVASKSTLHPRIKNDPDQYQTIFYLNQILKAAVNESKITAYTNTWHWQVPEDQ